MTLSEHMYCVAITFKMTEQVKQQICIRFCIKFEHSSVETIRAIQKAPEDDVVSAAQINCGANTSKMVENLLEVTHILEGLQQEHLRMLNVYGLQSTRNAGTVSARTRS